MSDKGWKHPQQRIKKDSSGVLRFVANPIVRDLLDAATAAKVMDLNTIAVAAQLHGNYSKQDQQQFAQLIGYSLSGYSELLSYVTDAAYARAEKASRPNTRKDPP